MEGGVTGGNDLDDIRQALRLDGKSQGTAASYVSHIRHLLEHFGAGAAEADEADVRGYFTDLIAQGRSPSYTAQAQSAIRFYYTKTAGRTDPLAGIGSRGAEAVERVLSRLEVASLLEAVEQPVYRLALMFMYSSGLRSGEVCCLRRRNVDTDKMLIRVNDRAGRTLRETILSKACLPLLFQCLARRGDDQPYLFPGRGRTVCVSARTLQRVFVEAASRAGVSTGRKTTLNLLRHSFAVHLLEDGIDRRLVQELMGVGSSSMMTPYVRLAGGNARLRVLSPLDRLPYMI